MACVAARTSSPSSSAPTPRTSRPPTRAVLRDRLGRIGVIRRLENPWLRDAITTAVLRQVVRADQARKLYRTWCSTYGTTVDGPRGAFAVVPSPATVLTLTSE